MGKLKEGWEDRAKREEILGPLEVSVPRPLGQFVASHPLLIPLVAKKVFSNLGKKDLLSVRRVCGEWQILGTETYRDRESIKMNVSNSTPFDPTTIGNFISVMTFSKMIPIVRFFIRVDPLRIPTVALPQLLTFIAPFARWIRIAFVPFPVFHDEFGRRTNPFEVAELLHGLYAMGGDDPDVALRMPCLEEFAIMGGGDTNLPLFRNPVVMLALKILDEAKGLTSFGHDYPFEPKDDIVQALPKGLKRLSFMNQVLFRSPVLDIPYSAFMGPGLTFHLEELRDMRVKQEGLGLADFLSTQKDSLRRMHVDQLEEVYRQAYPNFPQLKFVDKLRCEVNSNSTFEFLRSFPHLTELTIHLMNLKSAVKSKMNNILRDLKSLPQHPSVTKLHIRLTVAFPVSSTRTIQELLSFPVLAHCFPNVTHLSTPTGDSPRILTDLFTHFPNLQWLFLDFTCGNPRPRELESVLSGIPVIYCDALKAAGNYEDDAEEDEDADGIGLPNLKRLQTLEVGEDEHRFEFLFTELMFHRVFLKMDSLKAICFVKEDKIPEACLPFVERLKDKGIDLFRMKEKEG